MTKTPERNSENLQIKLDKIIERTKTQNRLLNKILDKIKEKENDLDKVNESITNTKK